MLAMELHTARRVGPSSRRRMAIDSRMTVGSRRATDGVFEYGTEDERRSAAGGSAFSGRPIQPTAGARGGGDGLVVLG